MGSGAPLAAYANVCNFVTPQENCENTCGLFGTVIYRHIDHGPNGIRSRERFETSPQVRSVCLKGS